MPDFELATHFLVAFAKCAPYAPPSVYIPPNNDLTDDDVDVLTPHFLLETPRSAVLEQFGRQVGYEVAFNFLVDLGMDPILKASCDAVWRTVINLLLKLMVTEGTLKWAVVNDPQFGQFSRYYIQELPTPATSDNEDSDDDTEEEGFDSELSTTLKLL